MRISQKKKKFQQKLKSLIKKYVKLLKLEDWEIGVVVSKSNQVISKRGKVSTCKKIDYYAEIVYKHLTKTASITLTKLQTIEEVEELEDTIFHELLHIKFAPLIETAESLINVAGLSQEKTHQMMADLDNREHELIETFIKLTNSKKRCE